MLEWTIACCRFLNAHKDVSYVIVFTKMCINDTTCLLGEISSIHTCSCWECFLSNFFCAINMIFTRDPIAIIFGMWLTMSKNYADATKYMTNRYSVLNVGLHFLHLDKRCRYALFRFAVTQSKYSSTKALIAGACWYWHSVHQHFAVLAAGPIHH